MEGGWGREEGVRGRGRWFGLGVKEGVELVGEGVEEGCGVGEEGMSRE